MKTQPSEKDRLQAGGAADGDGGQVIRAVARRHHDAPRDQPLLQRRGRRARAQRPAQPPPAGDLEQAVRSFDQRALRDFEAELHRVLEEGGVEGREVIRHLLALREEPLGEVPERQLRPCAHPRAQRAGSAGTGAWTGSGAGAAAACSRCRARPDAQPERDAAAEQQLARTVVAGQQAVPVPAQLHLRVLVDGVALVEGDQLAAPRELPPEVTRLALSLQDDVPQPRFLQVPPRLQPSCSAADDDDVEDVVAWLRGGEAEG